MSGLTGRALFVLVNPVLLSLSVRIPLKALQFSSRHGYMSQGRRRQYFYTLQLHSGFVYSTMTEEWLHEAVDEYLSPTRETRSTLETDLTAERQIVSGSTKLTIAEVIV